MNIYFVRHGETLHNRNNVHQHADVSLSERGKEEARRLGMALRDLPEPHIITSDLTRAAETADIIGKIVGTTPIPEPLFREMKRPAQIVNKAYYGFDALTIGLQLLLHARYASWHYSDEENLHDVRTRVCDSIEYLESISGRYEHVVVVSHAVFIKLLLIQLKHQKISIFAYLKAILKLKTVSNGCVTHVTCIPETAGGCDWNIEMVDNCAHLEDTADDAAQPVTEGRATMRS